MLRRFCTLSLTKKFDRDWRDRHKVGYHLKREILASSFLQSLPYQRLLTLP
jgi:hypothetical protein